MVCLRNMCMDTLNKGDNDIIIIIIITIIYTKIINMAVENLLSMGNI